MGPLAATWRAAAYEGSPCAALKPFLADAEVARERLAAQDERAEKAHQRANSAASLATMRAHNQGLF